MKVPKNIDWTIAGGGKVVPRPSHSRPVQATFHSSTTEGESEGEGESSAPVSIQPSAAPHRGGGVEGGERLSTPPQAAPHTLVSSHQDLLSPPELLPADHLTFRISRIH